MLVTRNILERPSRSESEEDEDESGEEEEEDGGKMGGVFSSSVTTEASEVRDNCVLSLPG